MTRMDWRLNFPLDWLGIVTGLASAWLDAITLDKGVPKESCYRHEYINTDNNKGLLKYRFSAEKGVIKIGNCGGYWPSVVVEELHAWYWLRLLRLWVFVARGLLLLTVVINLTSFVFTGLTFIISGSLLTFDLVWVIKLLLKVWTGFIIRGCWAGQPGLTLGGWIGLRWENLVWSPVEKWDGTSCEGVKDSICLATFFDFAEYFTLWKNLPRTASLFTVDWAIMCSCAGVSSGFWYL